MKSNDSLKRLCTGSALAAACFGLLPATGPCLGQIIAGFQLTQQPLQVSPSGNFGYSFTVGAQDISVTQLGIWDESGDGLATSHQIGLWDSSQNQLSTVTIQSGTDEVLNNQFRYHAVTPVTLLAGQTYFLGAFYDNSTDSVAFGTTATAGSGVSKGSARTSTTVDAFAFPDDPTTAVFANDGWFGPNAQFTAVPEPQAYATAAALALLGFALWKRAQLKSSASAA